MRLLLTLFLLGLTAASPADAQIVLPGTQPGDLVNWPLLPPSDCKSCHGDYVAGLDYEPYDSWAGTMMANSARDPLFWAAVDIANQDTPGSGEFCIRCHSPRAWLSGRSSAPDGSALQGFPDQTDNDFEGVDCHFCHRMYEGAGGTPFLENGQYWVDDGTPTQEPPRRGPFQTAFSPHPFAYSSYHESSEFCGVCHDLRNPTVNLLDDTGADTGMLFPEQVTYTEWTQSAFATEGTECQDCHMPPAPATPAFACNSFNPPRPDGSDPAPVANHDLAGANVFMMQLLKGEYGAALDREDAYDYSISRALDMLQNQSATVDLTVPSSGVEGGDLAVDIRVTNLTGHKLPTGYPEGRRMWIHLEATDAFGIPFWESGAYDAATATLTLDPQVQVYETKHGTHAGGEGFHLVLNDRIFKDNRIPPRGFMPTTETAPVGATYPVQPGGELAHWSDVQYTVPVPLGVAGPVQVNATLRYQTASKEYIEFLRDENVSGPDPKDPNFPVADSRGQKMYDLWVQYGKSAPVDMVSESQSVPIAARPANVTALNAVSSHNRIQLDWTLPAQPVTSTKILKKTWGDYPEFGSAGSALPLPGTPLSYDDAIANGWVEIFDGAGTTFIDTGFDDASRDATLYAAFTVDAQGIEAAMTGSSIVQATSYRIGDVGEIGNPGVYDGAIGGVLDLPVFSLAYGASEGQPGWNPECDFGPTHDGSSTGIPQPDDVVSFADLILFSLQFGTSDPLPAKPVEGRVVDPVLVTLGEMQVDDAGTVRLPILTRDGADGLKALRLVLDAPQLLDRVVALQPGPALHTDAGTGFAATVVEDAGLALDFAVLGRDVVQARDGLLGTLVLKPGTPQDAALSVVALDARGVDGQPIGATAEIDAPGLAPTAALWMSAAIPNPFNPVTELQLRVSQTGPVEVAVYDLAGRRVATLANQVYSAGSHTVQWRGVDDAGQGVASGVYLARATGLGEVITRRMVLIK